MEIGVRFRRDQSKFGTMLYQTNVLFILSKSPSFVKTISKFDFNLRIVASLPLTLRAWRRPSNHGDFSGRAALQIYFYLTARPIECRLSPSRMLCVVLIAIQPLLQIVKVTFKEWSVAINFVHFILSCHSVKRRTMPNNFTCLQQIAVIYYFNNVFCFKVVR